MRSALILIFGLAACNTPSPGFYGVRPQTVQVDGDTYRVFVRDGRAQAIRTNPSLRYRAGAETRVRTAIQRASGCKVAGDLKGDPVLASARLSCNGRPTPQDPPEMAFPTSVTCQIGRSDLIYCDLE